MKQKTKIILTIIFSIILISIGVTYVFFSQKISNGLSYLLLAGYILILLIAISLWLKLSEGNSILKMIFIASPFALLVYGGHNAYIKYLSKRNEVITWGIVTDTYSKTEQNTYGKHRPWHWDYLASIAFDVKGKLKAGECSIDENQYNKGDSIIVSYSAADTEIYSIIGKK